MSSFAAFKAAHDAVLDAAWEEMMDLCPPKFHPPKPVLPTRLLSLLAHAEMIGTPLLPHQVCIVAAATEGEGLGFPKRYKETLVVMGRQSGKSATLIALTTERVMNDDDRRVLWCAQGLDSAKEQFLQKCWKVLEDAGMVDDYGLSMRKDATPHIRCGSTRGALLLRSFNAPKSMRGLHADLVVMDEVFDILDDECESVVSPTMMTTQHTGASMVLASTAPLEHSVYLERKLAAHIGGANQPGSDWAFWCWEPEVGDDPGDPVTWRKAIPGLVWGLTTEEFLVSEFKKLSTDTFAREYLSVRQVVSQAKTFVVSDAWSSVEFPVSSSTRAQRPLWLGLDASPDGSIASVVAADRSGVIELVERENGVQWVANCVEELLAAGVVAGVALLVPGPLSKELARLQAVGEAFKVLDRLSGRLVNPVVGLSQQEFAVASQSLRACVVDRALHVVFSGGVFGSAVRQARRRALVSVNLL